MTSDHGLRDRNDSPQQASAASSGTAADRSPSSMSSTERSDRERSIATQRESSAPSARRGSSGADAYSPSYGPFALLRRMSEDMDRLFENLSTGRGLAFSSGPERSSWLPQVETVRRGDKLVVRADLPGMKKEDVNVEVDNGMLSISGERCEERDDSRDEFYRSERSYGQFFRSIPLPEGVTGDQVEASFKDGVLEVTVPTPKQVERKAKQIQIR
ncbi:MAG: Hsp20/alpha crystallin family protein [Gemmatimonadaceae bacterium]